MIKNHLQYKVSTSQLKKFEEALAEATNRGCAPVGTHPVMWQAQIDALESQMRTLHREISEYDRLVSGNLESIEVETLDELPIGLIKARIAKGLTQKDLAELAGVKPQQIQRWEEEDYYKAKFEQLIKIANALNVTVSERISFQKEAKNNTKVLKELGIDLSFLKRRICPDASDEPSDIISKSSALLKRIWSLVVHDDGQLDVSNFALEGAEFARFKLPQNANEQKIKAYAQYAYTVAGIVASAEQSEIIYVSQDWAEVRRAILEHGEISLENCLNYVWDLGVPVIPLSDPIRFHGGCWRIDGRNTIVLKQSIREESRWIFDLLHELHHASERNNEDNFLPDQLDGTDPERRESEEERRANEFAGNVLLNGKANEYFEEVLRASSRQLPYIKKNVQRVADSHELNVGIFANYVAFRLKKDFDADWWGAASNLQVGGSDAHSVSQQVFRMRCNLCEMEKIDRQLVELATSEPAI
ncbi:helix-turn-helix domain-containing protein [Marivita sp.]|jgi:transcriptional regulator with XRE-family HTH domain|uniref:helix-turn-helix domain-containing protein n=1 Tax=Marivita sp. TaxID=2003365 RepID=UPI002619B9C4|nr:helix-turn-helix domain-containing protein [Marivita sp.]